MRIRACRLPNESWPTILCIDDDPQISEAISLRLNEYEVNVLSAAHGMHGFWLAMTNRPQLVITDVHMPQGVGDYIVECLKHNSDTCQIPIIVLTGLRDAGLENRLRHGGADDFLVKPVPFEVLQAAIEKYVPLQLRDRNEVEAAVLRT